MAAILIHTLNVTNGGTRVLLLILLILALVLIIAGGVIATITLYYARKERTSPVDKSATGERY
jgi:hypothetical protein